MNRDTLNEYQRRYLDGVFAFTDGEDIQRAHFETLASDTRDALTAARLTNWLPAYHVRPDGDWNWIRMTWEHPRVPPGILKRWVSWCIDYQGLLERNPRLELRDIMQDIAEADDGASFPRGWEDLLYAWAMSGDVFDVPFEDGRGVATATFANLRRLRAALDGGWLIWRRSDDTVIYLEAEYWPAICQHRANQRRVLGRRSVD